MDNEFYQITDQRIGIHVNQEIIIGGKTVRVLKIMACNSSWLNRNYINPVENITNRIRYQAQPIQLYSNNNNNSNKCYRWIICCVLIIVILSLLSSVIESINELSKY